MQEHQFPFDVDGDLRREVKLEVERDKLRQEVAELKARLISSRRWAIRTALFGLLFNGLYKYFIPSHSGWWVLFNILIISSGWILEMASRWRALRQAERRLENWDAVAKDYHQAIAANPSPDERPIDPVK